MDVLSKIRKNENAVYHNFYINFGTHCALGLIGLVYDVPDIVLNSRDKMVIWCLASWSLYSVRGIASYALVIYNM